MSTVFLRVLLIMRLLTLILVLTLPTGAVLQAQTGRGLDRSPCRIALSPERWNALPGARAMMDSLKLWVGTGEDGGMRPGDAERCLVVLGRTWNVWHERIGDSVPRLSAVRAEHLWLKTPGDVAYRVEFRADRESQATRHLDMLKAAVQCRRAPLTPMWVLLVGSDQGKRSHRTWRADEWQDAGEVTLLGDPQVLALQARDGRLEPMFSWPRNLPEDWEPFRSACPTTPMDAPVPGVWLREEGGA